VFQSQVYSPTNRNDLFQWEFGIRGITKDYW